MACRKCESCAVGSMATFGRGTCSDCGHLRCPKNGWPSEPEAKCCCGGPGHGIPCSDCPSHPEGGCTCGTPTFCTMHNKPFSPEVDSNAKAKGHDCPNDSPYCSSPCKDPSCNEVKEVP